MEFSMPSITGSKKSDESTWKLYDEINRRLQAYFANKKAGKKGVETGSAEKNASTSVKGTDESYKKGETQTQRNENAQKEYDAEYAKANMGGHYDRPQGMTSEPYTGTPTEFAKKQNQEMKERAEAAGKQPETEDERNDRVIKESLGLPTNTPEVTKTSPDPRKIGAELADGTSSVVTEDAVKKQRNAPQGAEWVSNDKQPDAAYKSREEYYKGEEDVRKAMIQSGLDPDKASGIAERMRGKSATYVQNVIRQAQSHINAGQNPYWVWNSFA